MVGVDVRLQNPLDLQVLPPDGFDQPVRRTCRGPRGFRVEIQHAIDDRGLGRCRIGDNIADRIGRLVEESGYRCFHNSHILRLRCPAALEQTGIHPILIPVHPTVGSLNAVLCLGNHS
jgi:hypothetical protein